MQINIKAIAPCAYQHFALIFLGRTLFFFVLISFTTFIFASLYNCSPILSLVAWNFLKLLSLRIVLSKAPPSNQSLE